MRSTKISSFIVLAATALMSAALFAQQASDGAKTEATAQPSAPTESDNAAAAAVAAAIAKANAAAATQKAAEPAKPSDPAAFAKRAKDAGWKAEVHGGNTKYCRDDPQVGSRFSTRRCVDEIQLATLMEQADFDKDALKNRGCGGSCGGK